MKVRSWQCAVRSAQIKKETDMPGSFRKLTVWQRAIELVETVYQVTGQMPREEMYGLVSQMRRCAVSIPSNIAEGYRRKTKKDHLQFLHIADGSAAELETQIVIAQKIYRALDFSLAERLLEETQKMLGAFMHTLST